MNFIVAFALIQFYIATSTFSVEKSAVQILNVAYLSCSVRYRDPQYDDNYVFPAVRLSGAV